MPRRLAVFLLLALLPTALTAETTERESIQLGATDFPTSGSAEAQPAFLEGLLNLHSFEYVAARRAFQRAREIDPDFAMAAWGEAMTYSHPIWLEENREAALEALASLAPTPAERAAKAPTAREKAYLAALEILFGEGEKVARDHAYAAAMEELAATYPDDLDAAAFHALALLGTCHQGRDTSVYMRAAAIVEEVFDKNPRHPGAAHYLIHCYDDPIHAPLGLRPARIYAKIAPDAVHALHMPSHIFLALGMWDETVASNEDSFAAGERRLERLQLEPDRRDYHGLYWMHYALLQQGRYDEALQKLEMIAEDTEAHPTERTRVHYARMRAAHLVETEEWDLVLWDEGPDLKGMPPTSAAADLFATGMASMHRGELDAAVKALAEINRRIAAAEDASGTVTAGYTKVGPARVGPARVMALQLDALIQAGRGYHRKAFALLDEALDLEGEIPFGFGPAMPVKPVGELYGEMLLERGRAAEAREHLEAALKRTPRRSRALVALVSAAREAGEMQRANEAERVLAEVWHRADPEVSAGREKVAP